MDLKTLKLELLERIANLEDEPRLLALKRLLDLPAGQAGGPPTYTVPNDHLSIVREGQTPYLKLEDRMYTAEEVRKLVDELLHEVDKDAGPLSSQLSQQEWDELDADHAAYLRGEGHNFTWEEVKDQLRKDRGE